MAGASGVVISIRRALRNGGEYADLYLEKAAPLAILCEDDRLEKVIAGRERGVGLRRLVLPPPRLLDGVDPGPGLLDLVPPGGAALEVAPDGALRRLGRHPPEREGVDTEDDEAREGEGDGSANEPVPRRTPSRGDRAA